MAKYDVSHTCGHEATHTIFGKGSFREWKLKRLAEEPCFDCQMAVRNEHAAAKSEELALPALTGSDKQIAWATTLRVEKLAEARTYISDLLARGRENGHDVAEATIELEKLLVRLEHQTEAKFWIDNRHDSARYFLARMQKVEAQAWQS